jgi:D-3-phosphoglycerate dehydrogenase
MKVLISDSVEKECSDILKEAGLEVIEKPGMTPDELKSFIPDIAGLVVRSATKVTEDLLTVASNLKVVGRAGTGLDNVDIPACNRKGIVVMNTPGGNTNSAAEHTMAMILSISRHLPQATSSMKQGKWEKKKFMGQEVNGRTLGIIGIGKIGNIVTKYAQGFQMKVIAFDPYTLPEVAQKMGVEMVTIDELCARADYISVHTPLTPETKHCLNASIFAKMKKGAIVLNCARGGIINEKDLYEYLTNGHLGGAALDVFEVEPTTLENNPLLSLENFICTPHLGASTREAQENVATAVAKQIADYLTKGDIRNAVNVPSVSGETLAKLGPYLELGERLGSFISQFAQGPIQEVVISYLGELASEDTAPIKIAVLKGILTPFLRYDVNFVNAPVITKDRGIKVTESKSETTEEFTSLLSITVKTDKEENTVIGSIFGKKEPRLVKINNFSLDAIPEGNILLIYNENKPGVIGTIGTTLGQCGNNIARMHVGQDSGNSRNVILLTTDEEVSQNTLDVLLKQDGVVSAVALRI